VAFIYRDGFDWYTTADIAKRWTGLGSTTQPSVGPSFSRAPSGQGISVPGGNSGGCYKSFGTNYTQGLVGIAFSGSGMANKILVTILDGTTEQISIRVNASNVLTVSRGATLLATGTTVLSASTWYYIELKFSIHASAGTVLMQVNGVTETLTYVTGTSTTQNTKSTANVQWNGLWLTGPGNAIAPSVCWFDDLYVLDTSTGTNTTFLGPVRVCPTYMVAAGSHTDWTANGGTNFGNVSEMYEDGDTSFNQSSTANQIDSFVVQDLPAGSGSVFNVDVILVARQSSGATRTIAPLLRIGGSDYAGTGVALSTSYQFLEQSYDLQPVGGTPAWDISTFNAMEIGYKEVS
jgi:hypothetical protein